MTVTRQVALLSLVLVALVASGCGGGRATSSRGQSQAALSSNVVSSANANCGYLLRQAKRLGNGVLVGDINEIRRRFDTMVLKPGIPLLERIAQRQQALEPSAHSAQYTTYANLFDPIIVLAEQRLQAGEAGNLPLSKQLDALAGSLGLSQEQAARRLGLQNCEVDFQRVLINSLTG